MRRLTSLLIVFLMMSAVLLAPLPMASALQPLFPTLTISPLNPGAQEVTVTPSSIGSASYTAVVSVDKPPWGTVEVNLDCTVSTGWSCTVNPDRIVFTQPGDVQVSIVVVVPQAAPAVAAQVQVTGIATYIGGSKTAMASGTCSVLQYYRFDIGASKTVMTGNPAEVSIGITNLGNGKDSFKLDVENLDTLKDREFELSFSAPTTSELEMNRSENITLKIEYGSKAPAGKIQSIRVAITSVGSENAGEAITRVLAISVKVSQGGLAESAEEAVEDLSAFMVDYGAALIALIIILTIMALVVRRRNRKRRRMEEELERELEEGGPPPPEGPYGPPPGPAP